ncbi:hypothetical protein AB0B94_30610 [Micromonospora sp. NPDC048986]|uniref:hypothetical protein n=1 Tax=Micromonospora sp. NPDC048986 TaxID=3155644 RepID=UPI0033CE0ECF
MLSRALTYLRLLITMPLIVKRTETIMATTAEQITELGNKFDALGAVTTDILADFRAFRDAMLADLENPTEAEQAAIDEANAKLDAHIARLGELEVEVGDADGSDTPPVEPVEPGTDNVR